MRTPVLFFSPLFHHILKFLKYFLGLQLILMVNK